MEKCWKLGGYVLEKAENGKIYWGTYVEEKPYPGGHPFEPYVGVFSGKTWIEEDTLIMSSWKCHNSDENFHNMAEAEEYIASLPSWNKTEYFVKLADIGMTGLMDCKTNEPVVGEVADAVMSKLGFVKA